MYLKIKLNYFTLFHFEYNKYFLPFFPGNFTICIKKNCNFNFKFKHKKTVKNKIVGTFAKKIKKKKNKTNSLIYRK